MKINMNLVWFVFLLILFSFSSVVFAEEIPSWIKNTAGWWAEDLIEENEFLKSIEYLIDKEIILTDYDLIYENQQENNEIASSLSLHSTVKDATENPFPQDKRFRIDVTGQVQTSSVDRISVIVVFPDSFEIDISPTYITREGSFTTPGIKINPNSQSGIYQIKTFVDGKIVKTQYFMIEEELESKIPQWIKHSARWWSEGEITDQDFIFGIKHLLKEKIIHVERKPASIQKIDARDAQFTSEDIRPILFSITGERLEAFLDLKRNNRVTITSIQTDPTFKPVNVKVTANKDGIYHLPNLPFGTYEIKLNSYTEKFVVNKNGHSSSILRTTTSDGKVLCLGAFITYEQCIGHKTAKFESAGYKLAQKPEWYQTQIKNSFDYNDHYTSYSPSYDYDYDADVDYFLDKADYYAQRWINDIDPYARQWVNGEISWSEYERIGMQSFDNYANQFIQDFDSYFNSKYPYP